MHALVYVSTFKGTYPHTLYILYDHRSQVGYFIAGNMSARVDRICASQEIAVVRMDVLSRIFTRTVYVRVPSI